MSKAPMSGRVGPLLQHPLAAELRSPLQHRMSAASAASARVQAAELAHLALVTIRGKPGDAAFRAGAERVLGVPLPTRASSLTATPRGALLWQSPDEWLLVARRSERAGLLEAFGTALYGVFAQVVDSSGGYALLRLAGPEHVTVLRHLGPYDFERLAVGQGVGTVLGKANVSVLRSDAAGVLLLFRRSFADYVWMLVEQAARPYGLALRAPHALADPMFTPLLESA